MKRCEWHVTLYPEEAKATDPKAKPAVFCVQCLDTVLMEDMTSTRAFMACPEDVRRLERVLPKDAESYMRLLFSAIITEWGEERVDRSPNYTLRNTSDVTNMIAERLDLSSFFIEDVKKLEGKEE